MNTATITFLTSFWLTFLMALAGHPQKAWATDQPSTDTEAYVMRLESLLQTYEAAGFSGAVLVAERGQVVLAEGYGVAQGNGQVPVLTGTAFDIGTLAKSFTAVALLQLEADGRLALHDPLEQHLEGVPAMMQGITLKQLLAEEAALPTMRVYARAGVTREKIIATIMKQAPRIASTAARNEAHLGYLLLAAVVEQVADQPFASYVRSEILTPAGLVETTFAHETWRGSYFEAHSAAPSPFAAMAVQWGFGGLRSTVGDLYRWQQALHQSQLLSPDATQRLQAIVPDMLCAETACTAESKEFHTYAHYEAEQDRWIIVTSNTPTFSKAVVAEVEAVGVQAIETLSASTAPAPTN